MSNDCKCCGPALTELLDRLSQSIRYGVEMEYNNQRHRLQSRCNDLEFEVANLREELKARPGHDDSRVDYALISKDAEIRLLNEKLQELESEVANLREELGKANAELTKAQEEKRKLSLESSTLRADAYIFNSYTTRLISRYRNLSQYADHLENGLKENAADHENLVDRYRRWAFGGPERPE